MTFLPNFDIRYAEETDVSAFSSWLPSEQACDPFPFTLDEKEETLKNWMSFARIRAGLTGTLEGRPCAIGCLFLMPYRKVAHQASFFLIVDPEHRRKGVGTVMVRNLVHLGKTRFRLESIYAEIFEPNPMIMILEKQGFQVFARQPDFIRISDCLHDRILMEHVF